MLRTLTRCTANARRRTALLSALAFVAIAGPARDGAQSPRRWTIDTVPTLALGRSQADTNEMFAVVVGATRLSDGRIIVGDRGAFNLHVFAPNGSHARAFGRKGAGPGEIGYLKSLLRCGDSLVTVDIEGNRVSMFSLDGRYARSFRFGSPQAGRPPYQTACNATRVLAHYGWETMTDMKGGAYRPSVPFWVSGADDGVRLVLGNFPGSERFGLVIDGQMRGSRPLPLGKQPDLAVGPDRVYIGTADRYEILAFDMSGKPAGTIRRQATSLETTKSDIAFAKEREIATQGEKARDRIERAYATMPFPETVPAYAKLLVDSDGNLWVQDYPRAASPTLRWSVFSPQGVLIAEVSLPTHLEVFEIGRDYVLGRFLDPDESIPEVRVYRLRRAAGQR